MIFPHKYFSSHIIDIKARMDKNREKQRVMERKVVECEIVKIVQIM